MGLVECCLIYTPGHLISNMEFRKKTQNKKMFSLCTSVVQLFSSTGFCRKRKFSSLSCALDTSAGAEVNGQAAV